MKTNIKIRVTPEQSRRVQEICFANGFEWVISGKKFQVFYEWIYIGKKYMYSYSSMILEEIDADLFIRTNGTCEEDKYTMIDTIIHKPYNVAILEQKLQKKNEILKKDRIKRKNQREELYKLNLKLQKCISLGEHRKVLDWHIERNQSLFAEIDNLKAENIEMGKLVNLNKSALDLAVITKELAMNEIERKNNEIEKLKAVIEYLESKAK